MTKHQIIHRVASILATLGPAVFLVAGASCDSSRHLETTPVAQHFEGDALVLASIGQVEIRRPTGAPMIATGASDEHGRAVMANCGTCHATRPANPSARIGTSLTQFHQGLVGPHGNLTCASCHHAEGGYQSLRLADGSKLPYSDVMTLCAQCHGPQFRDYQHGAHGGMAGYWDLSKGGDGSETIASIAMIPTPQVIPSFTRLGAQTIGF